MASYQYIYTMRNLRKVFPGGREVLKDITLAFFPGAKIGVIGGNGAGKSTLLRIMAGKETEFIGEAWAAEGVRVGMLSQEPELDPEKDEHHLGKLTLFMGIREYPSRAKCASLAWHTLVGALDKKFEGISTE